MLGIIYYDSLTRISTDGRGVFVSKKPKWSLRYFLLGLLFFYRQKLCKIIFANLKNFVFFDFWISGFRFPVPGYSVVIPEHFREYLGTRKVCHIFSVLYCVMSRNLIFVIPKLPQISLGVEIKSGGKVEVICWFTNAKQTSGNGSKALLTLCCGLTSLSSWVLVPTSSFKSIVVHYCLKFLKMDWDRVMVFLKFLRSSVLVAIRLELKTENLRGKVTVLSL